MTDYRGKRIPSLTEITWSAVLTLAVFTGTIWVASAPGEGWRDSVAAALGMVATGKFVADLVDLLVLRHRARIDAANDRNDNTGVWHEYGSGSFRVRWSGREEQFYVQGWLGPDENVAREVRMDQAVLAQVVLDLERDGFRAEPDEVTQAVRTRLLTWLEVPETDPVRAERWDRSLNKPGPY